MSKSYNKLISYNLLNEVKIIISNKMKWQIIEYLYEFESNYYKNMEY